MKPYVKPDAQVANLKSNGLRIQDTDSAIKFLESINFHRFKIYLKPLYDNDLEKYTSGSFEEGVELYRFDDELRNYLFSVIGRIEIKLRTHIDHVVSSHLNDPFWYLDDRVFDEQTTRKNLSDAFSKSRNDSIRHYKENYYNNKNDLYKELPPFWIIVELATFGNIVNIYRKIKKHPFSIPHSRNNELDQLAKGFGASNLKELNNWIEVMRGVRNCCAHHSRVWNANFRAPVSIIGKFSISPVNNNRIYTFLAVLHIMNKHLDLGIDVKHDISELINEHPSVIPLLYSSGFPTAWETDVFWK